MEDTVSKEEGINKEEGMDGKCVAISRVGMAKVAMANRVGAIASKEEGMDGKWEDMANRARAMARVAGINA